MTENTNIVKKTKFFKPTKLVYARTSLQRKGLWVDKIALCGLNWDYLCRTHSNRYDFQIEKEFKSLRTKPHIALRSHDIRDKTDVNHTKAVAALTNLSPYWFGHPMERGKVKFNFFLPSVPKHKNHRKTGGKDSSIYVAKKYFINYTYYRQFIGFFIGYLIPEMQKRHMVFSYSIFDSKNNYQINRGATWHLPDLPQLLTSSLFPNSYYDYYDWSNSSLSFVINFSAFFHRKSENDEIMVDDDFFWNYFKIL